MNVAFASSLAVPGRGGILTSRTCRWGPTLQLRRASARGLPPPAGGAGARIRPAMTAELPETAAEAATGDAGGVPPGKVVVGAALAAFAAYTAAGPTNWGDLGALGDALTLNMDAINSVYLGVLGLSVVQGLVYALLLEPWAGGGAARRGLGALFCAAAGAAGFPAVASYLLLAGPGGAAGGGAGGRRWAVRAAGAACAAGAVAAYGAGLSALAPGEMRDVLFYAAAVDFARSLATDPWLRATAASAAALALCAAVPLHRDMRRRGWGFAGAAALEDFAALAALVAIPAFGPAIYVALRPDVRAAAPPPPAGPP